MKATATAPSNIAFVKYWGKDDNELRLPANGSLSMNLSSLLTTTTVEFSSEYTEDSVELLDENGQVIKTADSERVVRHISRVRERAGIDLKARVVSQNTFPASTGLSSSASGFAALTHAAAGAAGLSLSQKELTILARQGSGSACRSIPGGFVEWVSGETSSRSYAHSLYSSDWWELVDVVAVASEAKKDVSTTMGHKRASSSPFFETRQDRIGDKIEKAKSLIETRRFTPFGELIEAEALELHAVMITSRPSLIYWQPGTLSVMKAVKQWRQDGLECYFTINTGQDVHVICRDGDADAVEARLNELPDVRRTIVNRTASGTQRTEDHLF